MGAPVRRVTASDVARSLGISRATVGFVLNGTPGQTIPEATRSRVLAEAERLGYRPHAAARALARGSSRLVLFVLPDWPSDHGLRQYLDEAATVLDSAGYTLVTWSRRPGSQTRPLWESLDPDLIVPIAPLTDAELAALHRPGAPLLFPGGERFHDLERRSYVRESSAIQVRHLQELGHTRLAFAAPADPRLAGLTAARANAARACAATLAVDVCDERAVGGEDGSAAAAVRDWEAAGVTGVVAYDDEVAAAVAGAAIRCGVAVPGRLAVIGHDDSPIARLFVPALTSVRLDLAGMGRGAARAVLHALGAGGEVPEPDDGAQVVRREST
jgi:DNA-binding LacI/PurR family transcriptional regulator